MKTIILRTRSAFTLLIALLMATTVFAAYSAHQNDQDVNNFLSVYPSAKSTKLDDCALCHPGGTVVENSKPKQYGSCDYCHITTDLQPVPGQIPLNPYGVDYENAGRTKDAIQSIEGQDSDEDGSSNILEINNLFFPGDNTDHPGLTPAPAVVMNMERLLDFPLHSQFLLSNASKSADNYARYGGVKVRDLLRYVRASGNATQITVFAPDGFSKTFPVDAPDPQIPSSIQYDVMGPYPNGFYYPGLDFVEYGLEPDRLLPGDVIPDKLYLLLGYLRDGDLLNKGKLVPDPNNPARLVLDGEGPYRLVVPQKIAGSPDRPSTGTPLKDGYDYDKNKDHNAGSSVRSIAAIRVEPLPSGTTDFRWTEGGWNLVDKARLVVYGAINPEEFLLSGRVLYSRSNPLEGVQISIGLLSLGQVASATTDAKGRYKAWLPAGEYVLTPFKKGCEFYPPSIAFSLGPGSEVNKDFVCKRPMTD